MYEYVEALLKTAEVHAEKPAVVDRGGSRTTDYRTFGDLMQRAAAWVHGKQLGQRSFIPVRMDASVEYAAAVCGIWMAGHAAVPMGTSFPEERVRYISMSCEAPFIIDDAAMDEIRNTEILDPSVYPEARETDEAFLLYTSGSNGSGPWVLRCTSLLPCWSTSSCPSAERYICWIPGSCGMYGSWRITTPSIRS